jgi:hypothetical protein
VRRSKRGLRVAQAALAAYQRRLAERPPVSIELTRSSHAVPKVGGPVFNRRPHTDASFRGSATPSGVWRSRFHALDGVAETVCLLMRLYRLVPRVSPALVRSSR